MPNPSEELDLKETVLPDGSRVYLTDETSKEEAAEAERKILSQQAAAIQIPQPPQPEKKPKPGCKRCQGRGFEGVGMDPNTRQTVKFPCRCLKVRP